MTYYLIKWKAKLDFDQVRALSRITNQKSFKVMFKTGNFNNEKRPKKANRRASSTARQVHASTALNVDLHIFLSQVLTKYLENNKNFISYRIRLQKKVKLSLKQIWALLNLTQSR